jgi:hypothetical protein
MEILDYRELAYSRLTDSMKNDPVFMKLLDTYLDHKMIRQREYIDFADSFLDIDKSSGKVLDMIGVMIGEKRNLANFINRPYFGFEGARLAESFDVGYWYSLYKNKYGSLRVLSDQEYRRVLKARIIKNNSDGSRNDLIRIVNLLTNNRSATITEIAHGVVKLELFDVDGIASYYISNYKKNQNLIALPLGFRFDVAYFTYDPNPPQPEDIDLSFEAGSEGGSGQTAPNAQVSIVVDDTITAEFGKDGMEIKGKAPAGSNIQIDY